MGQTRSRKSAKERPAQRASGEKGWEADSLGTGMERSERSQAGGERTSRSVGLGQRLMGYSERTGRSALLGAAEAEKSGHFVDLDQRDSARVVGSADLHRVRAGGERGEEDGVLAAGISHGKGADGGTG